MIIKEIKDPKVWQDLIGGLMSSNFFYTTEWMEIVRVAFGLQSTLLVIKDGQKTYYFCFQDNGVSAFSSFIGYGGPLSNGDISFNKILEVVEMVEKRYKIIFKRLKLHPLQQVSGNMMEFKQNTTALIPICQNVTLQRESFHKSIGTSIRYAEKHKIYVKTLGLDLLDNFYRIYTKTMERVGSEYLTPKTLFKGLLNCEHTMILGAFKDEELVAVSVFLVFNKIMYYWWNASTEEGRKLCSNYILIYEAIKRAIDLKLNFLDMASSHSLGIEKPKLRWGAEIKNFFTLEKR